MRVLFAVSLWSLTCCDDETGGSPPNIPSEFTRFVEEDDGSAHLDTAIVSYRDDQDRRVDLVSVVHIGDDRYYQLLNQMFSMYDAVLFEMVMPADTDLSGVREGDSMVSKVQRLLKQFLDLRFQLDVINYQAENLVHADLEPLRFFALQKEKGESLFTLMLQAMFQEWNRMAENPEESTQGSLAMMLAMMSRERAFHFKYLLGQQLGDLERIAAGFEHGPDGSESVLVGERNKKAMQVLKQQLEDGDRYLAIFYGAAHMPDFERRLAQKLGFSRVGHHWLTAWNIQRSTAE